MSSDTRGTSMNEHQVEHQAGHKVSLAQRREALLVECALQRVDAVRELSALRRPTASSSGMKFKVPLTIASVVLGMVATRSGKAMPMLTAGISLIKMASGLLGMLRRH